MSSPSYSAAVPVKGTTASTALVSTSASATALGLIGGLATVGSAAGVAITEGCTNI